MKKLEELRKIIKEFDKFNEKSYKLLKNNLSNNISIDKLEMLMFHHDKTIIRYKFFF